MATRILSHIIECLSCDPNGGVLREITDNGDGSYTVEVCVCGDGFEFLIIDPDDATAKPWWDKLVGGWI